MQESDNAYPEGYDPMKEEAFDRWACRWLAPVGYAMAFLVIVFWFYRVVSWTDEVNAIQEKCGRYPEESCRALAKKEFREERWLW